jgi:hypothetical protein
MTDGPTADRLSRDEVQALKFAAHRQLSRWAKRPGLSPRQQIQAALSRAPYVFSEITRSSAAASYRFLHART